MELKERLKQVLEGNGGNYIFPFFWQHGEEESVLRDYMRAIREANIREVCVESRPHPDFAGPDWWRDMDIILEEAEKRGMRVWILDDQHFPTGYAAGAVLKADMELTHQYLDHNLLGVAGPAKEMTIDVKAWAKPQPAPPWMPPEPAGLKKWHDDYLFRLLASKVGEEGKDGETVDLTAQVKDGMLTWDVPEGYWKIYVIYLTRDAKGRNDYINFLDKASCRLLIDAVYEPHFARYEKYFGNVIAGFFSDEPPVGNTPGYTGGDLIGKPDMPLSWSKEMEKAMDQAYGTADWRGKLNLLWSEAEDDHEKAWMRTAYMNAVSRKVEECFSRQLGDWCEAHGVEYIGHMLEDCDSNANLGPSMGHFFRGLAGQHMAGIDNIGGQVWPGAQDMPRRLPSMCQDDAGFYHYMLGRMGASMGAIDPRKKGRCMCENFGAYGWRMGVKTEKYLMDHFLARGVNRFVPHAFSPKEFPDPDCPPHFYAHGKNPQYRVFGELMAYTNRICHLLDGGKDQAAVGLLYHGESQWAGGYESNILACRALTEAQINFLILPADVFEAREYFHTVFDQEKKVLRVNGQELHALVVSGCDYLTGPAAEFIAEAAANGFRVVFTSHYPLGVSDRSAEESAALAEAFRKNWSCVPVKELGKAFGDFPCRTAKLEEPERFFTVYHYKNEEEIYFFLNEDNGKTIDQWVTIPGNKSYVIYDAWENRLKKAEIKQENGETKVHVSLVPLEMMILVEGTLPEETEEKESGSREQQLLTDFQVFRCEAEAYPAFEGKERADLLHGMAELHPEFSGFYRYETKVQAENWKEAVLTIEDVYESAEVFVNGISAGMKTARPYRYELGNLSGEISIVIEVATTVERKARAIGADVNGMGLPGPLSPTGIVGTVEIFFQK